MKRRALYLLFHYPSTSEAYVEAEIRAVSDSYDVDIVVIDRKWPGVVPYRHHSPFVAIPDEHEIERRIRDTQPHVLHSHRLFMVPLLDRLSRRTGTPFTVRSHSLDTIPSPDPRVAGWLAQAPQVLGAATPSERCLGILAFPFVRANLESWNVPPHKIHDCRPVLDYARFHNAGSNGPDVIHCGPYMPKKRMEDYLILASRVATRRFALYALPSRGHDLAPLHRMNGALGNPVVIRDPVEPDEMPAEYRKHEWMVYTADHIFKNVGWPASAAEAQAAGGGVCIAGIRPDLRDYVGEAGYLYRTLEEAADIISRPFPAANRRLGFAQAKMSDVRVHRQLLTDLWDMS
jgi:hypothetical protein